MHMVSQNFENHFLKVLLLINMVYFGKMTAYHEEIHVIENWIFSDYQVLFLLLNDSQIENYL